MLVVNNAWQSSDLPRGAVVTIGNYDGLHLGQRSVIERVVTRARELGRPAMVITFDPHPAAVLSPQGAPTPLTLPQRKQRLLEQAGIDAMAVVSFTKEFARTSARVFVTELLAGKLAIEELYDSAPSSGLAGGARVTSNSFRNEAGSWASWLWG